jgi:hypothetical protein
LRVQIDRQVFLHTGNGEVHIEIGGLSDRQHHVLVAARREARGLDDDGHVPGRQFGDDETTVGVRPRGPNRAGRGGRHRDTGICDDSILRIEDTAAQCGGRLCREPG